MFGGMTSCNFADFWIVFGTIIAVIDILFINEWALIPLTKSAKEAQEKRKREKEEGTLKTDNENSDNTPDGKDNG